MRDRHWHGRSEKTIDTDEKEKKEDPDKLKQKGQDATFRAGESMFLYVNVYRFRKHFQYRKTNLFRMILNQITVYKILPKV